MIKCRILAVTEGIGPVVTFLLLAALLSAGDAPPKNLLYGELLEREGTGTVGTLSVRDDESHVYRCSFDAKTYIEVQKERASALALRPDDRLELLVDRHEGSTACYIRSIHIVPSKADTAPRPASRAIRRRHTTSESAYVLDSIYPRGNLTFSGVIVQVNPERLVLRTRTSTQETIFLRRDTRCLQSGVAVESSQLPVNRRVFIRAGRNLDNELEAFQIVWGDIFQPR